MDSGPPPPLPMAGEIDTTAPFESVKAAVNLFDEIADSKALKFPSAEKRASLELQQLRENLSATRHQLSQAQTAKNSLFEELLETKRLVEIKTSELAKVLASDSSGSDVARQADETYTQIEAVSSAVQEKYEEAVANLATTEFEVERLNAEIETALVEHHRSSTENSDDHRAEASTQIDNADDPIDKPSAAKEAEEKLVAEIAALRSKLDSTKEEIEAARVAEAKAATAAATAAQELASLRSKLESLSDEKNTLAALSESLRDELVKAKMELESLKDAAAEAEPPPPPTTAAAAELQKVRTELSALVALESKAKETIAGVTQALHKVTFEADESRLAAEVALEEAHRAKQELEEARAAAFTAESRLEAAAREAAAAKAGENMALAELKMLYEKKAAAAAADDTDALSRSKKENDNLRKRLQEAEDLADMKVAAAMAKADAAKASEREIRSKLEAVRGEVESNKSMVKQALHRAEMAEAAKSAIENELRRRRRPDQSATLAAPSGHRATSPLQGGATVQTPDRRMEPPLQHTLARRSLDYTSDRSFVSADVSAESIAQLLQLKVAPLKTAAPPIPENQPEKPERSDKKKKSGSKSFMKLLSRRKSSVGSTSPRN